MVPGPNVTGEWFLTLGMLPKSALNVSNVYTSAFANIASPIAAMHVMVLIVFFIRRFDSIGINERRYNGSGSRAQAYAANVDHFLKTIA